MKIGLQLPGYDFPSGTAALGSSLAEIARTADDVLELLRNAREAGIQHVIFNMPNAYDVTPIETTSRDIIPEVAGW